MHAHESWDGSKWPHMKHVANRAGFMLESPQDPKTHPQNGEGDESATFWAWDETQDFLENFQSSGMELINFDQGAFGHTRKKNTTCVTNLPDMRELDGCRSGEREGHLAVNLDERLHQSASWSLWAPGLCWFWLNGMGFHHQNCPKVWGWINGNDTSTRDINHTDGIVGHVSLTWLGQNHTDAGNMLEVLLGLSIWLTFQST